MVEPALPGQPPGSGSGDATLRGACTPQWTLRAPRHRARRDAGFPGPRRESTSSTISSGDNEESKRHNGFPARLARGSHSVVTTAPTAMCMMPFSGPGQRSCESCTGSRQTPPGSASSSPASRPTRWSPQRLDGRDLAAVPAPDGEHEPVPRRPVRRAGGQDHIGGGIVRVRRVRAVERPRGREPDVAGLRLEDAGHGLTPGIRGMFVKHRTGSRSTAWDRTPTRSTM